MRPNVLAIFSVVALAAAAALAIQQSPNFTSQTTGLTILTSDSTDYRLVVVPLPYREQPRTIRAPVPETEFATAWSTPDAAMSGMNMAPSAGQPGETANNPPTGTTADQPAGGR